MNKETFEALKRIIIFTRGKSEELQNNDVVAVEDWIRETDQEDTE